MPWYVGCAKCGVWIVRSPERRPLCAECRGVLERAPAVIEADSMRRGPQASTRPADVRRTAA